MRFTTMRNMVIAVMLLLPTMNGTAHAYLSFEPGNTFSGTAPGGSMSISFHDMVGGVQMVISSSLGQGENLDPNKALYLNFNPSKYSILQNLVFTLTSYQGFSISSTVLKDVDAYKADGDGYYDLSFTYGSSTKAFLTGTSQTYMITATGGTIEADDFTTYISSPGGGNGNWVAAIHVQNTPSGGSGSAWVGGTDIVAPVPIPASLLLLGSGLLGMMGVRRKPIFNARAKA